MANTIQHIASAIHAESLIHKDATIDHLLIDSRRLLYPTTSIYFALTTAQNDGHKYIGELVDRGVYNFVVSKSYNSSLFPQINFLKVDDVLTALQVIAKNHRVQFSYPVIGITGSNGKTIVKEWLFELMSNKYNIIRSPRSYNSQIGVPLSVWEMNAQHNFAIFEAGVSQKGEMAHLAAIIQPTIGIITSLGSAHQEGFLNIEEKLAEKLLLFKNSKTVIAPLALLKNIQVEAGQTLVTWGSDSAATLHIVSSNQVDGHTLLKANYKGNSIDLRLPFTDNASIENVITCWITLLHLGFEQKTIQQGVATLKHLDMRLQIKKGIHNCSILNDSYSNDLQSLQLGLEYAKQQAGQLPITLILSDFAEVQNTITDYQAIVQQLLQWPIKKLITIGAQLQKAVSLTSAFQEKGVAVYSYLNTENFIAQLDTSSFRDEFVMIKGARSFELERVNALLQLQVHQTAVEVNLTALVNNYNKIRNIIGPSVQIMAMVKAFGYGSGSVEIARTLQFHHVNYLSVAYVDEGVELRKAGIHLPIMVMNVDEVAFDSLVQYHLEPEIYSFELLSSFTHFIQKQAVPNFPIHIKLNTGMNRLGFDISEVDVLCALLKSNTIFKVQSIFSHLCASGQEGHVEFTEQQLHQFNAAAAKIELGIGYATIKHIANSDAILMDKKYHLDMVRLGIGMYGVNPGNFEFETVVQLQTTIAQIRKLNTSETVGYNRAGILTKESLIATVRLGYADGYSRKLGRGRGAMWVNGHLAPIVGDVCMDMTMIDITGIPDVKVGDKVEAFGVHLSILKVSEWAETIPYEILTSIGQRVKRVYIQD